MGVTPSSGEALPARAVPTSRNGEQTAKPETRSKFEEAMRRMRDGEMPEQGPIGREGLMPFVPPFAQRFLEDGGGEPGADEQTQGMVASTRLVARGGDGAIAANGAADIAPHHHAFAERVGLPAQAGGGETQLTMTDPRWMAAHATVRRDDAGGLSVEIQTRSDADADQQQHETLRSRLEARGHRISSIEIRQE